MGGIGASARASSAHTVGGRNLKHNRLWVGANHAVVCREGLSLMVRVMVSVMVSQGHRAQGAWLTAQRGTQRVYHQSSCSR